MFTHCSQCQERLSVSARGPALQDANSNGIPDRLTVQCIPCTAKGSREVRTALLIEAWDKFTTTESQPLSRREIETERVGGKGVKNGRTIQHPRLEVNRFIVLSELPSEIRPAVDVSPR